jgi:hypothetical protein
MDDELARAEAETGHLLRGLAALAGALEELERNLPIVNARQDAARAVAVASRSSTPSPVRLGPEPEDLSEMAAFVRGCLEVANASTSGRWAIDALDARQVQVASTPDGEFARFLRERGGRSYREILLEVIAVVVRTLDALAARESERAMSERAAHRRRTAAALEGLAGHLR